jgi:UPF0755 protein
MKRFLVFLLAVLFFGGLGGSVFLYQKFLAKGASSDSTGVIYEVEKGKPFRAIANELKDKGLIENSEAFRIYGRLSGHAERVKAGEYLLNATMNPVVIMNILTSGKSISKPFTVAEGLNIFEIGELYEAQKFGTKADFLRLCLDRQFIKNLTGEEHQSLEGYLYPETYQLTKFTTTKELITNMYRKFQDVFPNVLRQKKIQGLSDYQILILASIIEKETGAPDDRPLISSVFHNRLKKGMKLQTDPTIIYGMAEETQKTIPRISKADILRPTRYNTYVIKGLPPGPISNPGMEAMLAAVTPDQTEFLYFVSQNNGMTLFSKDYGDHSKAVRKFQVDSKARAGKSWRDLKKKSSPEKPAKKSAPTKRGA